MVERDHIGTGKRENRGCVYLHRRSDHPFNLPSRRGTRDWLQPDSLPPEGQNSMVRYRSLKEFGAKLAGALISRPAKWWVSSSGQRNDGRIVAVLS